MLNTIDTSSICVQGSRDIKLLIDAVHYSNGELSWRVEIVRPKREYSFRLETDVFNNFIRATKFGFFFVDKWTETKCSRASRLTNLHRWSFPNYCEEKSTQFRPSKVEVGIGRDFKFRSIPFPIGNGSGISNFQLGGIASPGTLYLPGAKKMLVMRRKRMQEMVTQMIELVNQLQLWRRHHSPWSERVKSDLETSADPPLVAFACLLKCFSLSLPLSLLSFQFFPFSNWNSNSNFHWMEFVTSIPFQFQKHWNLE